MSKLIAFSFKYFFPDKNFQNLYSSLTIILFNFLFLYFLSPINEIFLIFDFFPRLISMIKLILLSINSSLNISTSEKKYPVSLNSEII